MVSTAAPAARAPRPGARPGWTFLTNHPVVLIFVVQHPESTVRVIASGVGLTERATLAILRDLDDEGIVQRHRTGRRNTYVVDYNRMLGLAGGSVMGPSVGAVVRVLISLSPEGRAARREHEPTEHDKRPRVTTFEFFTNHTMLLAAIAEDNTRTVRELAAQVGVTERAAVALLHALEAEGVIKRHREGRRNSYTINLEAFRRFRGWRYDGWSVPKELVDLAVKAVRAVGRL